jgi:hypothetical protein
MQIDVMVMSFKTQPVEACSRDSYQLFYRNIGTDRQTYLASQAVNPSVSGKELLPQNRGKYDKNTIRFLCVNFGHQSKKADSPNAYEYAKRTQGPKNRMARFSEATLFFNLLCS